MKVYWGPPEMGEGGSLGYMLQMLIRKTIHIL